MVTTTSIDVFSGCGAMSHALKGILKPIAYCDSDPTARAVLRNNIKERRLPPAPIHDDVRTMKCPRADAVVAGVPCVGFSAYGHRKGFDNEHSALFFATMRVVDESRASVVFIENVPGIVQSAAAIVDELARQRGFELRWCTMGAGDAGAPHLRRRWFCLALKPKSPFKRRILQVVGPAFQPYDWSASEPSRTVRLDSALKRRVGRMRWGVIGNAVVADVVRLAFLRLFTMGAVEGLVPGKAPYVRADPETGASSAVSKHSWITVATKSGGLAYHTPATEIRDASRDLKLVLDPAAVKKPKTVSPLQSSELVTRPMKLTRWSTPRHGNTGGCHVLTLRSARDLSTQIKFERGTRNRLWPPNPEFGEWMMGMPLGFTTFDPEAAPEES